MSNYIELTFTVEPKEQGSDVLIAQLSDLGFESFVDSDKGFTAYIKEDEFAEVTLNSTISQFKEFFTFDYSKKTIPQQNWNKEWESNFQPIDIQGKCYIRAPFHEVKKGYIFDVIIEPKMSFGTGHHDTTQLMITKLMNLHVNGKSLLDMGCGTGVLAIVASMLGANPITAIDIDDWSYENTIENLQKNNITNVNTFKGDATLLSDKKFNFILANINKNILLKDISIYNSSLETNGSLVISGFFDTDMDELTRKATELGLQFQDKLLSNGWAVLHFKK